VLCGCPQRFDPRADPVRASPDAEADRDYRDAKARLDVGDVRQAEASFTTFLSKHPTDPLVPSAKLGQARALLSLGQADKAKEKLEPMVERGAEATPKSVDPYAQAIQEQVRYLLGFVLHKTGELRRSRDLLLPFVTKVAPGDDETELHAVLADDAYGLGDVVGALTEYGHFWKGARAPERRYLRDRGAELVERLAPDAALALWSQAPHDGLVAAYLGRRLANDRRAAGDPDGAARFLDESRGARDRVGLVDETKRDSTRLTRAVGCLLPLSGPRRAVGERAL
jgi:hypothetical protein